jgi:hypothetical protein
MNPSVGDLSTWPRNPLVRDSKRRPVGGSLSRLFGLVSLVGEPFGQLDRALMPSDLRAGG